MFDLNISSRLLGSLLVFRESQDSSFSFSLSWFVLKNCGTPSFSRITHSVSFELNFREKERKKGETKERKKGETKERK